MSVKLRACRLSEKSTSNENIAFRGQRHKTLNTKCNGLKMSFWFKERLLYLCKFTYFLTAAAVVCTEINY